MGADKSASVGWRASTPSGATMTTAEVMNWIAFGIASPADLTGASGFMKLWRVPPGDAAMRLALSEKADNVREDDRERLRLLVGSGGHRRLGDLTHARFVVMELLHSMKLSPADLQDAYSASLGGYYLRKDAVRAAGNDVVQAAVRGRLTPAARRHPQASDQLLPLDVLYFARLGAIVEMDGTITAPGDLGFIEANFLTTQVLDLWPAEIAVGAIDAGVAATKLSAPRSGSSAAKASE